MGYYNHSQVEPEFPLAVLWVTKGENSPISNFTECGRVGLQPAENKHCMVRKNGIPWEMGTYLPRLVDDTVAQLLSKLPALLLVGPRACGKTTTARRNAGSVVQLDRAADSVAFRADPDVALANRREPLLSVEWQAVPEVLGAVKRAVDADARPGRFLLAP